MEKIAPLVDTLRGTHGVGSVCHELAVAPSTYYRHRAHQRHPDKPFFGSPIKKKEIEIC
ncbi:truncated transposase (plasmid) [Escherichia coli SE11]|uniref:Truncated transposase n=1 Tax=Escherichia coli (strain SE11) TaxID=409438 RepID=A0A979GKA1_ECOSE|nr:truncated transposase [Escherichia coli SE11]